MLHRSSESVHIIWSMLFVAGALILSYMLSFDRGYFLLGLGEVTEVVADGSVLEQQKDPLEGVEVGVQENDDQNLGELIDEQDFDNSEQNSQIISLSQTLSSQQEVVSFSDTVHTAPIVGEGTQVTFDAPDPVQLDDKQFFSVQQLFAQGAQESILEGGEKELTAQGTLDLQNTYQRTNNGKFVLPEMVGVQQEVEYILKDQRNTHYVYLGDYIPLVLDTVEENGGTVVAIEDDLSINRRGFFGDRIWEISLPAYEARNKIVLLVVFESDDDTWLLQIDRDRFEGAGGEYLIESFSQHYMW